MTTGEYIKKCRLGDNKFGKVWSQEELGHSLNPPVNRAAINKWETGTVTNIRKYYIEQMSELFGITPADLMCFDSKYDEHQISEEVRCIELIQKLFGRNAVKLLQYYCELNDNGKRKALNNVSDMTEISKYID